MTAKMRCPNLLLRTPITRPELETEGANLSNSQLCLRGVFTTRYGSVVAEVWNFDYYCQNLPANIRH